MYELGVAQGLLDKALAEAASYGGERVVSMQIRLGDGCGIEAEHLRSCLDMLVMGTAAEHARLDIEQQTGQHIYLQSLQVE